MRTSQLLVYVSCTRGVKKNLSPLQECKSPRHGGSNNCLGDIIYHVIAHIHRHMLIESESVGVHSSHFEECSSVQTQHSVLNIWSHYIVHIRRSHDIVIPFYSATICVAEPDQLRFVVHCAVAHLHPVVAAHSFLFCGH